jgi:hypothetical protein
MNILFHIFSFVFLTESLSLIKRILSLDNNGGVVASLGKFNLWNSDYYHSMELIIKEESDGTVRLKC